MTKNQMTRIGMFLLAATGGYALASFEGAAHAQLTKPSTTAPSLISYPHVSSIRLNVGCKEDPALKLAVNNPTSVAITGTVGFTWGGKSVSTPISVAAKSSGTYSLTVTGAPLDCAKPAAGGSLSLNVKGANTVWYNVSADSVAYALVYIGELG